MAKNKPLDFPCGGVEINIRRTAFLVIALTVLLPSFLGPGLSSAAQKSSSGKTSQKQAISSKLNQINGTLSAQRKRAQEIRKQIEAVTKNLNVIVGRYNAAIEQLERTKAAIQENQARLDEAQERRSQCQEIVNGRVNSIYRHGKVRFLAVLLRVRNFREFLVRLDMLERISQEDIKALTEVKVLEEEIVDRGRTLEEQKLGQREVVAELQGSQRLIQSELTKVSGLLSGVQQEIARLEKEEREARQALARLNRPKSVRSGTAYAAAVKIDGFVFPVGGPHAYTDNFGDYRSGGRTHQGIDIFALRGTPVVAVMDGTIVTAGTQSLGGIVLRLRGRDGHVYSYAHLDGYASGISEGSSVRAGQTIGYVGDTGNAKGGAPHLHFEIHPGGGAAIDPYAILRGAG